LKWFTRRREGAKEIFELACTGIYDCVMLARLGLAKASCTLSFSSSLRAFAPSREPIQLSREDRGPNVDQV